MKAFAIIALLLLTQASSWSKLPLKSLLPPLTLSGDSGGHLDGRPWSLRSALKENKVSVIFYVDPDVKDKNEELSQALGKRNFSKARVQYIAIKNIAATWLPNFAIAGALKKKQQKYPNSLYLKDFDKSGVKAWRLADDENNVIILDKKGRVFILNLAKFRPASFLR